jgi:hypothetical protein
MLNVIKALKELDQIDLQSLQMKLDLLERIEGRQVAKEPVPEQINAPSTENTQAPQMQPMSQMTPLA